MNGTRSGFVPVVGRPNVGKSSLVNAMVGEKVAITSSRPQTTRNRIRGVQTWPDDSPTHQIVYVDTPGHHRPRTELGSRLNERVYDSLAEGDAVLFVISAVDPIGPGDRMIADRLSRLDTPVVTAVNKADLAKPNQMVDQLAEAGAWDFAAYVPTSATEHTGLDDLRNELAALLPEGPLFFPPDQTHDQTDAFVIGEIIREKFLDRLNDELPHSLVVQIRDMEERDDGLLSISARLLVERSSQRPIILGRKGSRLRDAGTAARAELELMFGTKVYLDLRVAVEPDWQRRPDSLDRLGFN